MENISKIQVSSKLAEEMKVIKNYGRRYAYLLLLALPFIAMELGIKLIGRNVNYFRAAMVFPNILFILIWTGLIVGVTNCLKRQAAKIFYNLAFTVFFFLYIVHGAYFEISNYFFGFSLLESASEGSSYILDAVLGLKPWFYVTLAVILFLFFFAKAHTPGWKREGSDHIQGREKRIKESEQDKNKTAPVNPAEKKLSRRTDSEEKLSGRTDSEGNYIEKRSGKGPGLKETATWKKTGLKEKTLWRNLLILLAVFVILHLITPVFYGAANEELEWDTWRNPHNVYVNFNDSNKCMLICGLMEYTVRDFYVTYLKAAEAEDEEELAILEDAYATRSAHEENALTGIFEGKNVIFLQLEGMDSWLITEEDTPNLYALMNSSIVFENHYSYFTGGGSTFNSELAVNTGFITPISYTKNPYSFTTNSFPYSLARMFGSLGYAVNCFHMNTEEYYQRGINYKNWGYDHYYSLLDENDYSDLSYELDRELILDEDFYDRLFTQYAVTVEYTESGEMDIDEADTESGGTVSDEADTESGGTFSDETDTESGGTAPDEDDTESSGTAPDENSSETDADEEARFAHYIITYTPHTPFVTDRGVGQYLAELIYGDDIPEMDEEAVARMMAGETDYMVGLLIQALKDNGLYENTVIVAYADHYLYTLSDETILEKYKTTENNLINQTPFFIWSSDVARIAEKLLAAETVGAESEAANAGKSENRDIESEEGQSVEGIDESEAEQSAEAAGESNEGDIAETDSAETSDFDGFAGGTILDGQGTVKLLADGSVSIHISKVNSQIDILPTVLNLFGIAYEDEYYVGSDIFDANYSGYAFFSDYSWYNGAVYASSSNDYQILGGALNDCDISETGIVNLFTKITDLIQKNDLTLKYDYLRRVY